MSLVRFLARPMLASSFVLAGMDKLRNSDDTAAQLSPLLRRAAESLPFRTDEKVLARVLGGAQVGAGVCFAFGKSARLAATVLAVISALNGYVEWRSADISSKEGREARRKQLLKNVTLIGGVLLAAVDTAGKPSLAWRAEHLAADAKKSAGHLAADARKTAGQLAADARKTTQKADKAVRKAVDHAVGA
ncbi:MAG: DoxX family protein [Arthrobacter sp.]|nr:DoxX family protein [Arthrobacter sp.]MCU1549189.1 DoxX family protein [Arthrobacter sp.]